MKNEKTQKKIGLKKILINLLVAIGVIVYLIGINLVYINFSADVFDNVIKIATAVLVGIGIILLEVSYKKDDSLVGWRAIEILIIAAYSLSIKHIMQTFNLEFESYIMESVCAFSIYYLLKSFIVYTIVKRRDLKDLSDISDIVNDKKPVKKEAIKRKNVEKNNTDIDENKIEEPVKRKSTRKTSTTKKTPAKAQTTKKTTKPEAVSEIKEKPAKKTTTRKRTTTKKADDVVEKETKTTAKKTTTTKKTATKTTTRKTTKKATTAKATEGTTEEVKPKRRGRPKKEVKEND